MKRGIWTTASALLRLALFGSGAIVFGAVPRWPAEPWFNVVLRLGVVLWCCAEVTSAAMCLLGWPIARAWRVRLNARALVYLLMSIGALITWTPVGYLIGSCLFVMGTLYVWVVLRLGWAPWSKAPLSPTT
jgi:hypothetical protein